MDPEWVHCGLGGGSEPSVWLDGGIDATSGLSLIGWPSRLVVERDATTGIDALEAALGSRESHVAEDGGGLLGWMGWLSYEVGAARAARTDSAPAVLLGFVDRAVVFDHATGAMRLRVLDSARDAAAWLDETAAAIGTLASPSVLQPPPSAGSPPRVAWRHGPEAYLERIRECQRLIAEGEVYQVCLCNECTVEGEFDPSEVYRRLRRSTPTRHGALFRTRDLALLCGSPEQFLRVDSDGHVVTRPIKGTRPRGRDAAEDAALVVELRTSEKERAENLMIVDLMRNDLARVCVVGSVEVTELFGVESYATVHQLVSTVEGDLLPTSTVASLLRATLAPGSMTGAPKRSAMDVIERLEEGARGVFSGVFGRFSLDGSVDLAVVIRSILLADGVARIGAGGGITALSVPEDELAEVELKARTMLEALGVAG